MYTLSYKSPQRLPVSMEFSKVSTTRKYDTFKFQGFSFNEFGFIRSDFSELMEAQSQQQLNASLSRLREVAHEEDTSKLSVEELKSRITSRYFQTPFEMDIVERAMIDLQLHKYGKLNEEYQALQDKLRNKTVPIDSSKQPVNVSSDAL